MNIPNAVPAGPAFGRNALPGSTKHPHPIIAPNAKAHTSSGRIERLNFPLDLGIKLISFRPLVLRGRQMSAKGTCFYFIKERRRSFFMENIAFIQAILFPIALGGALKNLFRPKVIF